MHKKVLTVVGITILLILTVVAPMTLGLDVRTDRLEDTEVLDTISGGPMDSAWPMQSHDTKHTGRSPYSTADNPYDEKWKFWTDGWIDDTPVIDNEGVIYFGGSHGGLGRYLYAIYPDGTLKWKYKTGGLIAGSSPAFA